LDGINRIGLIGVVGAGEEEKAPVGLGETGLRHFWLLLAFSTQL
jgi:hypothetical protein